MTREFITFGVGGQIFGLDIMSIREIRAWTPTTRVPRVPSFVAGVVNLRGTVLPVIDLASRLGWSATEATPRHAIIVTQLEGQTRGLIVDSVSDIVSLTDEALQPAPSGGDSNIEPFLEGLFAHEEEMIMVIDLAAINNDEELAEAA